MKALFKETLQLMGAEVKELPRNELHVRVPENSQACRLLESASEHLLSFSSKNENCASKNCFEELDLVNFVDPFSNEGERISAASIIPPILLIFSII